VLDENNDPVVVENVAFVDFKGLGTVLYIYIIRIIYIMVSMPRSGEVWQAVSIVRIEDGRKRTDKEKKIIPLRWFNPAKCFGVSRERERERERERHTEKETLYYIIHI